MNKSVTTNPSEASTNSGTLSLDERAATGAWAKANGATAQVARFDDDGGPGAYDYIRVIWRAHTVFREVWQLFHPPGETAVIALSTDTGRAGTRFADLGAALAALVTPEGRDRLALI